eukprot:1158851-Pelagomonas_calceolata.AAC.11
MQYTVYKRSEQLFDPILKPRSIINLMLSLGGSSLNARGRTASTATNIIPFLSSSRFVSRAFSLARSGYRPQCFCSAALQADVAMAQHLGTTATLCNKTPETCYPSPTYKPHGYSHLYSAIIDFQQLYNSILHDNLWHHLHQCQLPNHPDLSILKNLYHND